MVVEPTDWNGANAAAEQWPLVGDLLENLPAVAVNGASTPFEATYRTKKMFTDNVGGVGRPRKFHVYYDRVIAMSANTTQLEVDTASAGLGYLRTQRARKRLQARIRLNKYRYWATDGGTTVNRPIGLYLFQTRNPGAAPNRNERIRAKYRCALWYRDY